MESVGAVEKSIFFGFGSKLILKNYDFFNFHESSSWVEIRLHTEFGRVWLCRS